MPLDTIQEKGAIGLYFFLLLFHLLPELLEFLCSKASFVFPLFIIRVVVFFLPPSFFDMQRGRGEGEEKERES